jgi:uncharacterized membrane protein YphA (DoxX/SURF4 family)
MNKNALLYALGAILLGAVGIWFHEFAMQWQPVPAGVPARAPLAIAAGVILVAGGAALLSRKFERHGAWLLAGFIGLWTLVLNVPPAVASYTHIGAWNSPAEIAFMTMGALALASSHAGARRRILSLIARLVAGASACVFGFAHFNYIDFTATMVPAWIPPSQVFWAWATGAGHLAAGLALLSGIQARLAATLLAGMMGSFVLLVHLPRVIGAPDQHVEWIMLGVSSMLSGAALLVRKYAT